MRCLPNSHAVASATCTGRQAIAGTMKTFKPQHSRNVNKSKNPLCFTQMSGKYLAQMSGMSLRCSPIEDSVAYATCTRRQAIAGTSKTRRERSCVCLKVILKPFLLHADVREQRYPLQVTSGLSWPDHGCTDVFQPAPLRKDTDSWLKCLPRRDSIG